MIDIKSNGEYLLRMHRMRRAKRHKRKGGVETIVIKTHRSEQGIRAIPDRQKHEASPRNPNLEPRNATGPHRSNQFSLLPQTI